MSHFYLILGRRLLFYSEVYWNMCGSFLEAQRSVDCVFVACFSMLIFVEAQRSDCVDILIVNALPTLFVYYLARILI